MTERPFVPTDFVVPLELSGPGFRLVPLGPEHNSADHAAWSGSMEHIRATPGFAGRPWPHETPAAQNLADLEQHAADFAARTGFTYTVLLPDPRTRQRCSAACTSTRPSRRRRRRRDPFLGTRGSRRAARRPHAAVRDWLARDWPFTSVDYAPRP